MKHLQDGASPLFIAAQNGHVRVAQLLISGGASVDQRRLDNASPLWIAAQMNHSAVVRLLLKCGALVDNVRRVTI